MKKPPSSFADAVGLAESRAADAEVRTGVWLDALQAAGGNIAIASATFGFTRQRGYNLTAKLGLVEQARKMRLKAGQPATGRPKKDPKSSKKRQPNG